MFGEYVHWMSADTGKVISKAFGIEYKIAMISP